MNYIYHNILHSRQNMIMVLLLFIITSFILFTIFTYFALYFLKISIDYNNVFFYQYNKKCQRILDEYGDCKINKIYIVRQPFGKIIHLAFNILTLFNYNKYINESDDNCPYHPTLIFEINANGKTKFLLLEKNNSINICETFLINKSFDFKKVPIQKNKHTLNKVLKNTKKRIGNHKFFNWNVYKNNCQAFTKEILITLDKYNDEYKEFIFSDKIMKHYSPSDFTVHIINCLCSALNFVEKYLLDNNIFS
jgi:hypothetical protein